MYRVYNELQARTSGGGKPPENFVMPKPIFEHPFIYLGYIKKDEEVFSWLDFDIIHLVCPIFLSFSELLVKIENP